MSGQVPSFTNHGEEPEAGATADLARLDASAHALRLSHQSDHLRREGVDVGEEMAPSRLQWRQRGRSGYDVGWSWRHVSGAVRGSGASGAHLILIAVGCSCGPISRAPVLVLRHDRRGGGVLVRPVLLLADDPRPKRHGMVSGGTGGCCCCSAACVGAQLAAVGRFKLSASV